MILGLQIAALVFAFAMIYFALLAYKRGELNGIEIASWVVIWVVTLFMTIFPELLRSLARQFAVSRLFDLMVVGGFVLVITMASIAYIKSKRIDKKLEDYVRQESLRALDKKKSKGKGKSNSQ